MGEVNNSSHVTVTFRVCAPITNDSEAVYMTGSSTLLGSWYPNAAQELSYLQESNAWTVTLNFTEGEQIEYRYFIATAVPVFESTEDRNLIVLKWENFILPRSFTLSPSTPAVNDTFGQYRDKCQIGKGWLTCQTELRILLHSHPIKMWQQRHQHLQFRIKMATIDLHHGESTCSMGVDDDDTCTSETATDDDIEISILTSPEKYKFHKQEQYGHLVQHDDIIVFRTQTVDKNFLALKVDFYVHNSTASDSVPQCKGFAYILPMNLRHLQGEKFVPITGMRHSPIGQLKFDFLVIKPLDGYVCNMSNTYNQHWKHRGPLDVGHRGMGTYYNKQRMALSRENTIASLKSAGRHGADFVEFDVHLSFDKIPVLYHDFTVFIIMQRKSDRTSREFLEELYEIPVKDLSCRRLQMLKLRHAKDQQDLDISDEDLSPIATQSISIGDHQPFPRLVDALNGVGPHIGFNIEVKYPMQYEDDRKVDLNEPYFEKNEFIDAILLVVLQHANNRRIVFSTFDVDSAVMLQMKQNKYPVMLLVNGERTAEVPYTDVRARSPDVCVRVAQAEKFLGLCINKGEILLDPSLVERAHHAGMIVFGWGIQENEEISSLKQMGLEAVIFDRINEYKSGDNVFMVEYKEKMRDTLKEHGTLRQVSQSYAQVAPKSSQTSTDDSLQ